MRLIRLRAGRCSFRLHPAMLLAVVYAVVLGHAETFITALLSILVHEAAHALAAALTGFPPSRIELTPLGAVMYLDDEEQMPPLSRVLMVLAGPAMSFALCAAAFALTQAHVIAIYVGRCVFLCNLTLVLFNLLPVLPLDGGRLLAMLLAVFLPRRMVRRVMCVLSTGAGIGLIACNVLLSLRAGGLNFSLGLAGCFIIYSANKASASAALADLEDVMRRKNLLDKNGFARTEVIFARETCLVRQIIPVLPSRRAACILVLDDQTQMLLGAVCESRLLRQFLHDPDSKCRELLE